MKWSSILLFPEMKAGQQPGVSYERYAKQSVVCQDTLRVLGHWLCPCVIYYPSQWAHSCLLWPFHRALQSPCVHSTSPSPVPALPHPVCFLISTSLLDLSNACDNTRTVPAWNWWEMKKSLLAACLFFYNHQPSGQIHTGNMSTIKKTDRITGKIPFHHTPVHKQDTLSTYWSIWE